jgi:hypothetical protein
MNLTIDDAVAEARRILNDTNATVGYRYDDATLVSALNMGLLEARRLRPDLFRAYYGAGLPRFAETDLATSTALPVNEMYMPPLAGFMAGWVELTDDEFTIDNRAGTLLQRFAAQLTVGG